MLKTHIIILTAIIGLLPLLHKHFNIIKMPTILSISDKMEAAAIQKTDAFFQNSGKDNPNYRIKKVVIDPGHGGHDHGCSGKESKEKHLALAISKKIRAHMNAQHPDVQVILTRESDVFIPLHRRAAIANDNEANLFISVHCNSISTSKIHGSETYVLGTHRFNENLEVAKRENAAVLYEDNYENKYNFNPNSNEGHITISLFQNFYLEQSLLFAGLVEENIKQGTPLHSRGVKQAGFLVLRETAMPSVLIETGYLTNVSDENYLSSVKGQNKMAAVITQAFTEYRNAMEYGQVYRPTSVHETPHSSVGQAKPQPDKTERVQQAKSPTQKPIQAKYVNSQVQYRVQIATSSRYIDTSNSPWNNLSEYMIEVVNEGGTNKYQVRGFYSYAEAEQARRDLVKKGFKNAWVLAYRDGKRISIRQAKQILGH